VDAVSARPVIDRALGSPLGQTLAGRPLHVIAVGKAAAAMAAAFVKVPRLTIQSALAVGTHAHADLPASVEWIESSHPFPDARSQRAAERALGVAERAHSGDVLVILLSGGASALMAAPIDGLTLADKIATTKLMMEAGADIHALNTVRRHLSKVKGGRLAAACVGTTITLAISDVVGDDLNAIGSGPGVPDATTWADAAAALDRFGGDLHLSEVQHVVARGVAGEIADTPKPGSGALKRAQAAVIGSRVDAMEGVKQAALARGYHTVVIANPVVGEARDVAPRWLARARELTLEVRRPACVISGGETTVRVTGQGRGGRNLEFALSLAESLVSPTPVALASIGTDGIDGSSGVAGAIVDSSTMTRASALGLDRPGSYLAANDSLAFFAALDDTVRLGRTDTNVGDLQVLLID
jgi:hydroxypyruvate reductase